MRPSGASSHSWSRAISSSTAGTPSSPTPNAARRASRRPASSSSAWASRAARKALLGPEPHARRRRGVLQAPQADPRKIAAKAPSDGKPCVTYCGARGAGHFVKMVHNGIEYGDMQLIAEAYDLLKNVGGLSNKQLKEVFEEWNESELKSFLIEITSKVIDFDDPSSPARRWWKTSATWSA